MLKRDGGKQLKMTFLTLEELMPENHFLRDLERCVDFSFIYDIVEPLYARVGRPSVDPVLLVKMLLLGYLYGIPSERKLEQEVRVNIAFRWFLGIDFDEPVPDHSTISQLRRRKFGGTTLFQDIFDEVVRKCMAAGLVTGKLQEKKSKVCHCRMCGKYHSLTQRQKSELDIQLKNPLSY